MINSEEIHEISVKNIKFLDDVYPRLESGIDQEQVNLYRMNIDKLPAILITKDDFILIDGAHRLRAHEIERRKTIKVVLRDVPKSSILLEAIKHNSIHGKQLSMSEKKQLIPLLYDGFYKKGFDYVFFDKNKSCFWSFHCSFRFGLF